MNYKEIEELAKAILTIERYTDCDIEELLEYLSGHFLSEEEAFRIKNYIRYDMI